MSVTRTIARLALSISALALVAGVGRAGTIQGSAVIQRGELDVASGQVYIYAGGHFVPNETVTTFTFLGDPGAPAFDFSNQRFITPLLLEETSPGIFVVRGIGTGQTVTSSGSPQSFQFNVQQGLGTTTSGLFTFGFVNALVDSTGHETASSAGTVSLDITVTPGTGLGGVGTTNDWVFTPTESGLNVSIGTSYGRPGNSATFALNSPSSVEETTDRTYSASLNGFVAGVPEPGTLATAAGGLGLLLVGILRRRKVS